MSAYLVSESKVIAADPQSLFASMARVSYEWRGIDVPAPVLDQIAAEAA